MWFLDNLGRLDKERSSIKALREKTDWLRNDDWHIENDLLTLAADIRTVGNTYKIQMVYPHLYPLYPPSIFPRDSNQHWSSHQYKSGELCLEWGLDTWNESLTGADILISAHKLLYLSNPQTNVLRLPIPSRHNLSQGQEIRASWLRFIIHQSSSEYILSLPNKPFYNVVFSYIGSRASSVISIRNISLSDNDIWENPNIPKELENTSIKFNGLYIRTSLSGSDFIISDTKKFHGVLEKSSLDLTPIHDSNNKFLLFSDHDNNFHLVNCLDPNNWLNAKTIILTQENTETRTGMNSEKLENSKVGIIGLGSAGSKIAISLARSGVCNFMLVDDDLFLPENLTRHELTWDDIGQHKVDGIKHMLCLINPRITVDVKKITLSGQEASSYITEVIKKLTECDLIIDATADPDVFLFLSDTSFRANIHYLWLEIYGGGIGGLIARFRPKHEPHPQKMKAFLYEQLSLRGVPALKSAGDYSAITTQGEILVATDSDVSIIAGYATNMALDILCKREPPTFPHSVYLTGLQKGWIFSEPFDTQPFDPFETTSVLSLPSLSTEKIQDNLNFIKEIMDK